MSGTSQAADDRLRLAPQLICNEVEDLLHIRDMIPRRVLGWGNSPRGSMPTCCSACRQVTGSGAVTKLQIGCGAQLLWLGTCHPKQNLLLKATMPSSCSAGRPWLVSCKTRRIAARWVRDIVQGRCSREASRQFANLWLCWSCVRLCHMLQKLNVAYETLLVLFGCAMQAADKVLRPPRSGTTTCALTSSLPSLSIRVRPLCSLVSLPDCAQQVPSQTAAWL